MKMANGKTETSTETNLKHERDTNTTSYAFLRSPKMLPQSILGRKVFQGVFGIFQRPFWKFHQD